jgi:hypothetical protein
MACNPFQVPFSAVSLSASTAKTVAGVKAATNVPLKILEAALTMNGTTSSDSAALVEPARCTFATNSPGTNSTSTTPVKLEPGRAETIQATAGHTWTTEPTVITALDPGYTAQYTGAFVRAYPFAGAMLVVAGAAGFVIRVTPGATVTGSLACSGWIKAEE